MNDIEKTLKKYFNITGKVTVHPNSTVDVDGGVKLKETNQIEKLPVRFGTITGDFFCKYNELKTLEGAPQSVGGSFSCSNNQLQSLQGAPQSVGGYFYCTDNQLTSLQGAPQSVGGEFWISYSENLGLLKLITKDINFFVWSIPDAVFNIVDRYRKEANSTTQEQRNALAVKCAAELIRAGYRNNARL